MRLQVSHKQSAMLGLQVGKLGLLLLGQAVGGVGGEAGLEGGGGLCGQVVDHSLSSGMML